MYVSAIGSATRLFKEGLVASFLPKWGFNSISFAGIQVLPEHIPIDLGIQRNRFNVPCFGLAYLDEAFDLSKLSEDMLLKAKERKEVKAHLLKLAFFDIWLSNEDRHLNNYNILVKRVQNAYKIYPIDHEAAFNHDNLMHDLYVMPFENTLLYSPIFHKLFNNNELTDIHTLANLKKEAYLCVLRCQADLNDFLGVVPGVWDIDIAEKRDYLDRNIFRVEWFEECWREFLNYIQIFINNNK
jgi:hypothetical protein